jgi:hypothetical protein
LLKSARKLPLADGQSRRIRIAARDLRCRGDRS